MRKVTGLFLLAFFLLARDYDPDLARRVELKLQRIEKESGRFFRWLSTRREVFSQKEVNSYINYALEKREGNVLLRGARVVLGEGFVLLGGGLITKKPLPGFEIGPQGWQLLVFQMKFRLLQKDGKYRVKVEEAFLGRNQVPLELFSSLLPVLTAATGLNFDQNRWEPLPLGVKRVEIERGKLTVYY